MFTRFMVKEIIVICFICQHQHIFEKSRMLQSKKKLLNLQKVAMKYLNLVY